MSYFEKTGVKTAFVYLKNFHERFTSGKVARSETYLPNIVTISRSQKPKPTQMHGSKYMTCNYSPEFRCRIYQINPYDLSCMYKIMFEKCATNMLLEVSKNDSLKSSSDITDPQRQLLLSLPECSKSDSWLDGWDSCSSCHSTFIFDTSRSCWNIKRVGRSQSLLSRTSFPPFKEDINRNAKAFCVKSFDKMNTFSSMSSSYSQNVNKIPYEFRHYEDVHDYIIQYRLDYTYKRLQAFKPYVGDYCYSTQISPVKMHEGRDCVSCDCTLSTSCACTVSPPTLPSARASALRKNPKLPEKTPGNSPRSNTVLLGENSILKMEFDGVALNVTAKFPVSEANTSSISRDPRTVATKISAILHSRIPNVKNKNSSSESTNNNKPK